MDQHPEIDPQAKLPKIHQKYLDYQQAILKNDLNRSTFKKQFEEMFESYNQYFDKNVRGFALFEYFIIYEDLESISTVFKKIKQLNVSQEMLLQILKYTVATSNKEILQILVAHGLNIDLPDGSRSTQLAIAAGRCDGDLCSILLSCGANIRFVTPFKKSVLALACESTAKIDITQKIDCINLLSVWYLSIELEPLMSNIEISDDIAKNIFLFGASKFGETITADTYPQFKYAYKDIDHFLSEVEKNITDKAALTSLANAVNKCLLIQPQNSTLNRLQQYLDKHLGVENIKHEPEPVSSNTFKKS